MPNDFDLEYQYQLYLERVKLKESEMPEDQRQELRRAFMGACGQMLALFANKIPFISDDEGIQAIQSMSKQVLDYFGTQALNVLKSLMEKMK
jgi:hypothetical protein